MTIIDKEKIDSKKKLTLKFAAGVNSKVVKNKTMFNNFTANYIGHDTYEISASLVEDPQTKILLERNGATFLF